MKRVLVLSLLTTSIFASGSLYQEFNRRKNTLQSQDKFKVYRILRANGRSQLDLVEIEEVTAGIEFVTKDKNNEVCSVKIEEESINCYNSIGLGTLFAGGDSD